MENNNKSITSIDWLVEQIENQQKFYIELAKKDKTKRKEVDAILTATTLLRMKCGKAEEMHEQEIINAAQWMPKPYDNIEFLPELAKQYYKETYEK
jgi:hypothetical protein